MENTSAYYLAGPMTGYAENNVPAFIKAKDLLEKQGYNIELPYDLETVSGIEYARAMSEDIKIVLGDKIIGIFLLPGWQASRGAKIEAMAGLMMDKKFFECHYSPKGEFFIKKIPPNDIAYNIYRNSING